MRYWDDNQHHGTEDAFLADLYQSVKIHKIPEYEEKESIPEYTCGICGLRDSSASSIWSKYNDSYSGASGFYFIKPDILYKMKFPLDVVIPAGLTKKDRLCESCKDWIDFIYKMQSRVGLDKDKIPYYEQDIKNRRKNHNKDVKRITLLNELLTKKLDIINDLRKEVRKLNNSKANPNKEKLKKELAEISDKIELLDDQSNRGGL